jgi:hypothetical protein
LNARRQRISIDGLVKKVRSEPRRVLADDEIGLIVYVGDLDVYIVTGLGDPVTGAPPSEQNGFFVKKVSQLSVPRFPADALRHQIGSAVVSVSADAVFLINSGSHTKKVRGDKLKAGMVLITGEKVYW